MINIFLDENFKRSYKKVTKNKPELKIKFKEKLELLSENPFSNYLHTHKLSGRLKNLYAFTIEYDLRVIFKFIDNQNILLVDIGSHDVVY